MAKSEKNDQQQSEQKEYELYIDEKTKEKMDKHLTDINDTISENDIQNVNTDITSGINNSVKEPENINNENGKPDSNERIENLKQKEQTPTVVNILNG